MSPPYRRAAAVALFNTPPLLLEAGSALRAGSAHPLLAVISNSDPLSPLIAALGRVLTRSRRRMLTTPPLSSPTPLSPPRVSARLLPSPL